MKPNLPLRTLLIAVGSTWLLSACTPMPPIPPAPPAPPAQPTPISEDTRVFLRAKEILEKDGSPLGIAYYMKLGYAEHRSKAEALFKEHLPEKPDMRLTITESGNNDGTGNQKRITVPNGEMNPEFPHPSTLLTIQAEVDHSFPKDALSLHYSCENQKEVSQPETCRAMTMHTITARLDGRYKDFYKVAVRCIEEPPRNNVPPRTNCNQTVGMLKQVSIGIDRISLEDLYQMYLKKYGG